MTEYTEANTDMTGSVLMKRIRVTFITSAEYPQKGNRQMASGRYHNERDYCEGTLGNEAKALWLASLMLMDPQGEWKDEHPRLADL